MTKEKGARTHTSATLKRVLGNVSPKDLRKTEQRMLLAAKIADALEASGMSRSQLAIKLGKHPSEITKWLSGTHNFTSDTLFELQEALGIRLIHLELPKTHVVFHSGDIPVKAPAPMVWLSEFPMESLVLSHHMAISCWAGKERVTKTIKQKAPVCYG